MTTTCYTYIRVSTQRQADKGLSLDAQMQRAKSYYDFRIAETDAAWCAEPFEDRAKSAYRIPLLKRPAGGELNLRVRRGDHVLFTRLDRGFRDALDFMQVLKSWNDRGITIHFMDLSLDMSTPVGQMVASIMAINANWESHIKSQRQKEINEYRRNNGLCQSHGPRLGFKRVGRREIPDLAARQVLAEVRYLRGLGHGWQDIADTMNRHKIDFPRECADKWWTPKRAKKAYTAAITLQLAPVVCDANGQPARIK